MRRHRARKDENKATLKATAENNLELNWSLTDGKWAEVA